MLRQVGGLHEQVVVHALECDPAPRPERGIEAPRESRQLPGLRPQATSLLQSLGCITAAAAKQTKHRSELRERLETLCLPNELLGGRSASPRISAGSRRMGWTAPWPWPESFVSPPRERTPCARPRTGRGVWRRCVGRP